MGHVELFLLFFFYRLGLCLFSSFSHGPGSFVLMPPITHHNIMSNVQASHFQTCLSCRPSIVLFVFEDAVNFGLLASMRVRVRFSKNMGDIIADLNMEKDSTDRLHSQNPTPRSDTRTLLSRSFQSNTGPL